MLVLASDAIFYVLFAFTVVAVLLSVGLALFALAWSVTRAGGARPAPRARIERARN